MAGLKHEWISHQLSTASSLYSSSLLVNTPLNVNRWFYRGSYRKTAGPPSCSSDSQVSRTTKILSNWQPALCLSLHQAGENETLRTQVHINTQRAIKPNVVACAIPCLAPGRGCYRQSSVTCTLWRVIGHVICKKNPSNMHRCCPQLCYIG